MLLERLESQVIESRKNRQGMEVEVLSFILAEIRHAPAKQTSETKPSDREIEKTVDRVIKRNSQVINSYGAADSPYIERLRNENAFLFGLLPARWSQNEIREFIEAKIAEGWPEFEGCTNANGAVAVAMKIFKSHPGNQKGSDVSAVVLKIWEQRTAAV